MHSAHRSSYRLYRMRWPIGALLSLPLILTVIWYAWSAFAQIDRYQRATEDRAPWSFELFQLVLHDELVRDLRRFTLPERPANSALPTFDLSLNRDAFDALNAQLYSKDERRYVKGYLQKDGDIHPVQTRYRGSKPWHWLSVQKSLKLRTESGHLIDGARIFNLLNDPTPFGMEDQITLDLAGELDLLAPEYRAVRMRLNNSDMGVYRYAAQPVEGLLRQGRRMPGVIYSGDTEAIDPHWGVGALFFSRNGWQQVVERFGEEPEIFEPLDQLLEALQTASFADFATYAHANIDLDRYATFDALDVAFGGSEHDYFSNHKLYFDPYRGKFEPVTWNFRGFKHEPLFNRIDHPLLIRLKMTPGYLTRRNRALYELLVGKASVPEIRARAERLFKEMAPDLNADPHWDAYKLLPRVTRFHRFMVRPMSVEKWLLAARAEIHGYSRRVNYLLNALESLQLDATAHSITPTLTRIDLRLDGHSAQRLRDITVTGPCNGTFAWRADVNRNGRVDASEPIVASGTLGTRAALTAYADLLPGAQLIPQIDPLPKRGNVRIAPEPRTYTYLLTTSCAPSAIALVLDDQITGSSSRLALAVQRNAHAKIDSLPTASDIPTFTAGVRTPHLWDFPAIPAAETINLGPGVVQIPHTQIYRAHQKVVIAPGTRFAMGPDVSLIFQGQVTGIGTLEQPISIVAAQVDRPFGGIAIQGPSTSGSTLKHLRVEGGSQIDSMRIDYPSLFSIYDTQDIYIEAAHFSGTSNAEDVLHAAYVKNINLREIEIVRAPIDAVDLEFVEGQIRDLHVLGAGDDCLDLMGVDLHVVDGILLGCTNNAISAGEESEVSAHGLFIGDSKTGLLAKNNSHARIARSLVWHATTALQTKRRDIYYAGNSSIGANDLFVVDCETITVEAQDTHIQADQIHKTQPTQGALEHLARRVLGLSQWSSFDLYAARLQNRARQ